MSFRVRVGLLFSTYELRFPSWLARASALSPSLPLPPFPLSFPPVSLSPLTRTLSLLTNFTTKKDYHQPNSPLLIPVSASISHKHAFSHETSSPFFFCLYHLYIPRQRFSPVIIMCSPFPFFSLSGAISICFSAFLICCISILLIVNRRTFPFPSLRTASNPCVIYRYLCDCLRIHIIV